MKVIPEGFRPCARWKTYCSGLLPIRGSTGRKWCDRCQSAQRSRRERDRQEALTTALGLLALGWTMEEAAGKTKFSRTWLAKRLEEHEKAHGKVKRRGRGNLNQTPDDDHSGERCRCGLRLPCHDCLPPLHHFATTRREA